MFLWRSSSKCKASGTRSSDWGSVAFKLFKLHLDWATASTHASSMSRRKLQRASTHALTGHTPKSKSVSEDVIGSIVRASTRYAESRDDTICRPTAVAFFSEDESCCFTQFTPTLTDVRTEYSFHNDVLRSLSQEGCAFKFNQTQSGISNLTTFIEK